MKYIFYIFLITILINLFFRCTNSNEKHIENGEIDKFIEDIKLNLEYINRKPNDSVSLCFSMYNGKRMGWEYTHINDKLFSKRLFVNDTLANLSVFYDENMDVLEKKSTIYSPILNKYILSQSFKKNDSFGVLLDCSDTIYSDLNSEIIVHFELVGDAKRFEEAIQASLVNSDFKGTNRIYLFKDKPIAGEAISFRVEQYGIVKIFFELKDANQVTVFMNQYLFVLPKRYENYNWNFLNECVPS
jgi:hypothetical protein